MSAPKKIVTILLMMTLVLPIQSATGSGHSGDEDAHHLTMRSSRSTNCNPPVSGQWDITVDARCVNEQLTVNGNITVSARFELIDTDLTFANDHVDGYDLKALPGSELRINGSTIDSNRTDRYFSILVDTNVTFSINNSVVDGAGWKDLERFSGASSGAERTEYNRYFWLLAPGTTNLALTGDDGIEIRSTPLAFHNNTFSNYTHIRFFSDDNVVDNNTFMDIKHEGVAFMHDTVRHTIKNNDFYNATRINREVHGIRFYPNNQVVRIHHNTFDWIPFPMTISNIPPWTSGYSFDIHDNDITRAITGFNGNFRNSRVHHNDFHYNWKHMSIEAGANLLVDNNTFEDVTFQKDLENIVTQQYYNQVDSRGLLANMAYWMWGFYCSKFHLNLGWWGRNITISDNHFSKGPPYTMALNTDQHSGMSDVKILNNTFEDIGTYIPNGYTVRNDWTSHNDFTNQTPLTGSAIMLEGSDDVTIKGNIFMNVVNGVTTSGPDALGNFGSFEVGNNLIRGVGEFSWNEQRYSGSWWSGSHNTSEEGLGIATSIHYIEFVGPDWQPWHLAVYESDSLQHIHNNTIYDLCFPVVIDFRRDQSRADEMGNKTALVEDNLLLKYIDTQQRVGFPNRIDWNDNVEKKKYPVRFPNVDNKNGHDHEAGGQYYLVPGGMVFPDHEVQNVSKWRELTWTPVDRSGDVEVSYSTDGGDRWSSLPKNGSLEQASTFTGRIRLDVHLTTAYHLTRALVYDLNLTYVCNSPPVLEPLDDITAPKNQQADLVASATDADHDTLNYVWEQINGPNVTLTNDTTNRTSFTPAESGVYRFMVEVGDGFVTTNDTMTVSVENRLPTMTVQAPTLVLKGQEVVLNGTAQDEDGDEMVFNWNQTQGPTVVLNWNDTADPSFIPIEVGTYGFNVEVSDGEDTTGPVETILEVVGRPPVANLSIRPTVVTEGEGVVISANGSEDPDGEVVEYLFDTGDNTTVEWSDGSWIEHKYDGPGEFRISLTVRDDDGNLSTTVTRNITVLERVHSPQASFRVAPENGKVGTRFTFTDTSIDTDGEVVSREWDMGDGTKASGRVVFHQYPMPGIYAVVLTVTDDDGLGDTTRIELNITPEPNTVPSIVSRYPEDDTIMRMGRHLVLRVTAEDDDGDDLSYTWLMNGVEVEGNGSTYDFLPEEAGVVNITVRVTDQRSEPIEVSWSVTVRKRSQNVPEDNSFLWTAIGTVVVMALISIVIVFLFLRGRGGEGRGNGDKEQGLPVDFEGRGEGEASEFSDVR